MKRFVLVNIMDIKLREESPGSKFPCSARTTMAEASSNNGGTDQVQCHSALNTPVQVFTGCLFTCFLKEKKITVTFGCQVLVEETSSSVRTFILNRPNKLNALSYEMVFQIWWCLNDLDQPKKKFKKKYYVTIILLGYFSFFVLFPLQYCSQIYYIVYRLCFI